MTGAAQSALFLSPHLDDVAFSCGGTVAGVVRRGRRATVCTVFTESTPPFSAFALSCQTNKGISPDTDYLALRREEDRAFAVAVGAPDVEWWGFTEAPYRGYPSSASLFQPVRRSDRPLVRSIAARLVSCCAEREVTRLYFPAAIGKHVDHVIVRCAVVEARTALRPCVEYYAYEDLPYRIRQPDAAADVEGWPQYEPIDEVLDAKIAGAACYASQLGFQFGGQASMAEALRAYAQRCAREHGRRGAGEVFVRPAPTWQNAGAGWEFDDARD